SRAGEEVEVGLPVDVGHPGPDGGVEGDRPATAVAANLRLEGLEDGRHAHEALLSLPLVRIGPIRNRFSGRWSSATRTLVKRLNPGARPANAITLTPTWT